MKKLFTVSVMLMFVCGVSLLAMGGQDADSADTSGKNVRNIVLENTADHVTVLDSYGNKVTVKKPVKSFIVSGMGDVFAAVKALDAKDMVPVSTEYVTRNTVFFPEFSKKPSISKENSIDNERILQLNPNFIVTVPSFLHHFNATVLQEFPVIQLEFNTPEVYTVLGTLLDKEKEAADFVKWIKSYTDKIDSRIAKLSPEQYTKVFAYYGGPSGMSAPPPYGTFGKENMVRNQLIKRAGGKSLSESIPGDWITVDPEWVIAQNPPLILRECYIINAHPELGYSTQSDAGAKALLNNIMHDQPALEGCDAVKNKNVHLIYGDIVQDSWFIALAYMAKWFHPDLFTDLDPEKMHQEYLDRFQKLGFNVKKQGLFTYSAK